MGDRTSTGIMGLDEMLRGGLPSGSTVLIQGAPGVGKTTFGLQFLYHGATKANEAGLLVTFEEFPESIYRDALNLGWDLRQLEAQNQLRVLFTSPEVFLASLQAPMSPLSEMIRELNVKRLVLDSMAHFRKLAPDPEARRKLYTQIVNACKREALTVLLLNEAAGKSVSPRGEIDYLLFVVDGVILLGFAEVNSEICRALTILKIRGSDHAKDVRRFEIKPGGILLGDRFEGQEGVLASLSRRPGEHRRAWGF